MTSSHWELKLLSTELYRWQASTSFQSLSIVIKIADMTDTVPRVRTSMSSNSKLLDISSWLVVSILCVTYELSLLC